MVTPPFHSEFVRQENVQAFLVRLETERDPAMRALLTRLLAEHGRASVLKSGPSLLQPQLSLAAAPNAVPKAV